MFFSYPQAIPRLTNKQQPKVAAVKAWQTISKEERAFGDVHESRILGQSVTAKDFHLSIKNNPDMLASPVTSEPLKMGG